MNFYKNILTGLMAIGFFMFVPLGAIAQDGTVPVPQKREQPETPNAAIVPETAKTPKPVDEDTRVYQAACPAVLSGLVTAKRAKPIEKGKCGERSPLKVTAFGNVKLTQAVILNCRMATGLAKWVGQISEAGTVIFGQSLTKLGVSTSYQCRRRNNAPTGKISEHGFANALDISAFHFQGKKTITVEKDWQVKTGQDLEEGEGEDYSDLDPEPKFLRLSRDAACETFTTVLSPETNAAHADHFHLDLGCHGKTCTYKICE